MELYEIKNLSFKYNLAKKNALENINVDIKSGEFALICGKSGCGKSTLLRLMKKGFEDKILFCGKILSEASDFDKSADIGYIRQNFEGGIISDKVWRELAFLPESLGAPTAEIAQKTAETAEFMGIENIYNADTDSLSGGQKQLLRIAAALTGNPKALILDEPTSQLDPIAAQEFADTLARLNRDFGITVIIAEHNTELFMPFADRLIIMENGKILSDGGVKDSLKSVRDNPIMETMPVAVRLFSALNDEEPPVSVKEGRKRLEGKKFFSTRIKDDYFKYSEFSFKADEIYFRYDKNGGDILKGLSLEVPKKGVLAILGGNGAGKSTLLSVMSGMAKPYRGKLFLEKSVAILPQNPLYIMTGETVAEDLNYIENNDIIRALGIKNLLERNPNDISGGELQRAALAKILLNNPKLILLDEPTKGLDGENKKRLADIIRRFARTAAVVIVSHDTEFAAENADLCALLFDGGVTPLKSAREFFANNKFYTTPARRLSYGFTENAVTVRDLAFCMGAEIKERPPAEKAEENDLFVAEKTDAPVARRKTDIVAVGVSLALIAATLLLGASFNAQRRYYLISLLVMLEIMLPQFVFWERRKPSAEEISLMAVICVMCALSRAAFFMFAQIKPMAALIMVSAAALGKTRGFVIGAFSAFLSNFFFGQGPWTPWQTAAFGVMGYAFGCVGESERFARSRTANVVLSGVITLIVYGGIMNFSSLVTYQDVITLEMALAVYAAGLPFDLLHAVSTAVFMFFIYKPVYKRLKRLCANNGL